MASAGAWLLSVPGTPHLPLCAANTHCRSSVQLRSLCATQMPGMVHDRAGSLPGIVREMSGNQQLHIRSCCLEEMLGTASPVSH